MVIMKEKGTGVVASPIGKMLSGGSLWQRPHGNGTAAGEEPLFLKLLPKETLRIGEKRDIILRRGPSGRGRGP